MGERGKKRSKGWGRGGRRGRREKREWGMRGEKEKKWGERLTGVGETLSLEEL